MENTRLEVGVRVYRSRNYQVCSIQTIVSETGKYFKLANGILISKENGKERGTGNGNDWMSSVYYHPITADNEEEITLGLKQYTLTQAKLELNDIKIRDINFKIKDADVLILHLTEAIRIINEAKAEQEKAERKAKRNPKVKAGR